MPKKARPEKAVVKQDPEKPVERPVLADAIIRLSRAARSLNERSGLNEEGIVTLLQHSSKLPRRDIFAVLDSIKDLERAYCRK